MMTDLENARGIIAGVALDAATLMAQTANAHPEDIAINIDEIRATMQKIIDESVRAWRIIRAETTKE